MESLVILTLICLVAYSTWFFGTGGFNDLHRNLYLKRMFYKLPRKLLISELESGNGLVMAVRFVESVYKISIGKYETSVGSMVEIRSDGCELDTRIALYAAYVDLYCFRKVWKRYLKRYPEYSLIKDLDFTLSIEMFGRYVKEYGKI